MERVWSQEKMRESKLPEKGRGGKKIKADIKALAVARGNYTGEELQRLNPDYVFADLVATNKTLKAILQTNPYPDKFSP